MKLTKNKKAMSECPFPVEEKITEEEVQAICDDLKIPIDTTAQLFMTDLNLYYAGYEHHKRLQPSNKQEGKLYEGVNTTSRRLLGQLEGIVKAEDSFLKEQLNSFLLLSCKQERKKSISTIEIISTLKHLIKASETPLGKNNSPRFICPSRSWFLAVAIPKLYTKHTGLKYSRSFNTEHNYSGQPHSFAMRILSYFDDFKTITDRGLDSAILNYQKSLKGKNKELFKEYEWPYEWTTYRTA